MFVKVFIKLSYTTNYSRSIGGALIRANLKLSQKISQKVTHGNPNSPSTNATKEMTIFPSLFTKSTSDSGQ